VKHFEDIRSYEQFLIYKQARENFSVREPHPGDTIVGTEKLDGANASFWVDEHMKVHAYSRKTELDEHNTLRGFYTYIKKFVEEAGPHLFNPNFVYFGEWLVSHSIKYKDDSYNQFYLFDIYDKKLDWSLGYLGALEVYDKCCFGWSDSGIKMAPMLCRVAFQSYDDLEEIQYDLKNESRYSKDGNMEGIVFSDLDCLNDDGDGYFRIKFVNQEFKEIKFAKHEKTQQKPEMELAYKFSKYLTVARINKKINEVLDENPNVVFDMTVFKTQTPGEITERVYNDILKEGVDLPLEDMEKNKKYFMKSTRKSVCRVLAISIKEGVYKDLNKDAVGA
jgi:hypothetical protein